MHPRPSPAVAWLLVSVLLATAPLAAAQALHACVPQVVAPGELCANSYLAAEAPATGLEVYTHVPVVAGSPYVTDMEVHDGRLYLVRLNGAVQSTADGDVWQAESPLTIGPLGSCGPYATLGAFNGKLYAGASAGTGARLWRLDGASWTLVATMPGGCHIYSLKAWAGKLHIGTSFGTVYTYDGSGITAAFSNGLGTQGAAANFADDGANLFVGMYPKGIAYRNAAGAWQQVPGVNFFPSDVGVSGGVVYAASGDTVYRVQPSGIAPAVTFPGRVVGALQDISGHVGIGVSGPGAPPALLRWDGVADTTLLEGFGTTDALPFAGDTFVSGGDGRVERVHFLVDLRPLPEALLP